ncbi:AAA family ATPase [Brevibacterium sp.]|uniref:AAA family ATPase n=1 Tax=Brevibacterium sp. TaxID=1701 RepID=UPI00342E1373
MSVRRAAGCQRSVGKSALLTEVVSASPDARSFDFDDPEVMTLAEQSPSLVAKGSLPTFIDEYQRLPAELQSITARLNKATQSAMFVLAGSASCDSLPAGTQALTGRIQRLPVLPRAHRLRGRGHQQLHCGLRSR